ncbi:MAG: serine/threonine-protein phosphatase [Sphingomonadales bacterium]|nr:serine/threonine-protein phosphatase [Sphingomonadales bacterium]
MTGSVTKSTQIDRFETASRTHVGIVRETNEDRVLAQPQSGLWAIADGMGGHSLGDRAAALVVSALSAIEPSDQGVREALESANASIRAMGRKAEVTCGSTVAGLCISQASGFVFWVGDSRVYRLRDDRLTRLTRDHSFVQELRDAGVLTDVQARADPRSNIITRAVGIADMIAVDITPIDVRSDDLYLICSDGLSDLVDDATILSLLDRRQPEDSADKLVRAALAAGGADNISLTIIADRASMKQADPEVPSPDGAGT